jgi:hypothetical protein
VVASLFIVVAALLATATLPHASAAAGRPQQHDFAALRRATSHFRDVDKAIASGRADLHLCVDHMSQHYANPETFDDGRLDPIDPEAMVYADDGKGHLRLVAVEWVSMTPGRVMNVLLHFNPSVGLYVLHAWIWAPNPDGVFADMNPRIGDCPA